MRAWEREKRCPKCGLMQSADCFYPDSRYSDGRYPYCKACKSAAVMARYERKKYSLKYQPEIQTVNDGELNPRIREVNCIDKLRPSEEEGLALVYPESSWAGAINKLLRQGKGRQHLELTR